MFENAIKINALKTDFHNILGLKIDFFGVNMNCFSFSINICYSFFCSAWLKRFGRK